MNRPPTPGPLSPYRVLDLTEGGAMMAGRVLGDLGADVVKIEPPGGSPSRDRGPFAGEQRSRDRSLFWSFLNLNKRGVTLDLSRPAGRNLLLRLVRSADVLLESFQPGTLQSMGLAYRDLSQVNPRLVMASITPFGQSGPYSSYKGPDIVTWGMAGALWMTGDPDRPPVHLGTPEQASFHAASSAVAATLIALRGRRRDGRGRHIDQSAQQHCIWLLFGIPFFFKQAGVVSKRAGGKGQWGSTLLRTVFPCKDGHVSLIMAGGVVAQGIRRLVDWMASEGMASPWLRSIDWMTYDPRFARQDEADNLGDEVTRFFQTKTKQELLEGAVKKGVFLAPINNVRDVAESPHLAAKNFWMEIEHSELGRSLRYPGLPLAFTAAPSFRTVPAPAIGEHNAQVYRELGIRGSDLEALRTDGVI